MPDIPFATPKDPPNAQTEQEILEVSLSHLSGIGGEFNLEFDIVNGMEHPGCTTNWSPVAERGSKGVFVDSVPPDGSKAASRFACRRTPYSAMDVPGNPLSPDLRRD